MYNILVIIEELGAIYEGRFHSPFLQRALAFEIFRRGRLDRPQCPLKALPNSMTVT